MPALAVRPPAAGAETVAGAEATGLALLVVVVPPPVVLNALCAAIDAVGAEGSVPLAGAVSDGRRLAVTPRRGNDEAPLFVVVDGKVESGTPVVVPVLAPPAPDQ